MKTHDYTKRFWGHDFTIMEIVDGGQQLHMMGWGHGIQKGDYLLLPNKGATTHYKVHAVDYFADPPDMWKLVAKFSPRSEAGEQP